MNGKIREKKIKCYYEKKEIYNNIITKRKKKI